MRMIKRCWSAIGKCRCNKREDERDSAHLFKHPLRVDLLMVRMLVGDYLQRLVMVNIIGKSFDAENAQMLQGTRR